MSTHKYNDVTKYHQSNIDDQNVYNQDLSKKSPLLLKK